MICKSCTQSSHDSCTAIVRGAKTWCDCQHGHKQALLRQDALDAYRPLEHLPVEEVPAPSPNGQSSFRG